MTSLHASVLGFTGERSDRVSDEAVTMAERFHRTGGYQTAVFTANPNAATVSGLERWADLIHEPPGQNDILSSVKLHDAFWDWRAGSSGQPYWAHFQPTDVHAYEGRNAATVVPFSGLFVAATRRREFLSEWDRYNQMQSGLSLRNGGLEAAGIDRRGFFETMRAMYDESLAHQDYQIGRLVERLQERGEWDNTLLIIAGDHAIDAALDDVNALAQATLPPPWNNPMLASSVTRVPLIVVWPGHITGGRRLTEPVSMIDVLPTVLDLVGLPTPDVMQGQSLAPLLRGQPGWTPRPVIFDEFTTDSLSLSGSAFSTRAVGWEARSRSRFPAEGRRFQNARRPRSRVQMVMSLKNGVMGSPRAARLSTIYVRPSRSNVTHACPAP